MLRLAMKVLWPSFLAATSAEGVFFSLFDPDELLRILGQNEMLPIAGYTMGFFFFWTFCALASMLTYYLFNVPDDDRSRF
jgi:hypothetical protein